MSLPFLLEVGSEEIPDWMIQPALNEMRLKFEALLDREQLGGTVLAVDATPRRLVLRAKDIQERQADIREMVQGPATKAGTGAASGFARKLGVAAEQLKTQQTAKGEYFVFEKQVVGKSSVEILSAALPELILKLSWPKSMYWNGKGTSRFIRPIRWIVALLGDEVVPFAIEAVHSGSTTRGHRLMGADQIPVSISTFEEKLEENGVVLAAATRRERIQHQMASLLDGSGFKVKPDELLLETLVYITEYPTPILGSFDASYLTLPHEVLVEVMKKHQKYFSVEDYSGKLAAKFVAVMNIDEDAEGLVRRGNERVLRARFNDARFFYDVDQRRPLPERLEDLSHVTFHAKLGSYREKADRMARLAQDLGGSDHAQRAALLAKCDLTTDMVKEFTDLQGVIGGIYARAQGEPEAVAHAIYEHYKPLSMEDSIPQTAEGRLVALADKLDTLRQCFAVGMIPSGSKDPFALRRAAQGVVKIIVEARLDLSMDDLVDSPELREFFLDRLAYYFREVRGFRYDEVRAVLKVSHSRFADVEDRLTALAAVRPTENFEPVAASFKRVQNILKQANFVASAPLNERLMEPGPERELYDAFLQTREQIAGADYRADLEAIASLRPKVDLFFDKVLVNAPEAAVRQNRLTLLNSLLTEFSTIADFSEIVTTKD